jgi:uncharacterized protein (TIGR02413 family)
MTFNILFFSITVNKRKFSQEEILQEIQVQKITEELRDRKCSMQHLI